VNNLSGNNKFSRAINRLNEEVARLRPGQVVGALVDSTTRGTFVRPLRNPRARAAGGNSVPRYG
jgi:hypothetical protein